MLGEGGARGGGLWLVLVLVLQPTTMAAVNLRPHELDVGSLAASPNSDSTLVKAGWALTMLAIEQSNDISDGSIDARDGSW